MKDWPSRKAFWSQKRVLVTGGAGFLGSHVLAKLENLDLEALVVPRSAEHDLREPEVVRELLNKVKPQVVLHLAARVGGIGANRAAPANLFYDNLMLGVPLLHHSWLAGVEKFVGVGSVCSYPDRCPLPFSEDDVWNGYPEETNAPYGLAKRMLIAGAKAYRAQHDFNAVTLMPVNMYGPGDHVDLATSHVLPALIRKCLEAREREEPEVVVWGTGIATREFLYVEDAAEAILLAAERYNSSAPVNLGSGREVSIRELIEKIVELTGFQGKIVWDDSKPDGQLRRQLDTSRALEAFGFQAQTSFEQGLANTIEWFESLELSTLA